MDTPCRALIIVSVVLASTAFAGCGVRGDKGGIVAAITTILHSNHLNYSTVNSSQLNEMGESQIRGYRLLIVPGGNFIDIAVVGKVVEGTFGSGWVILTGVHPEAPASWRDGVVFNTPVSAANAYAGTLVHAALNRTSLSHY